MEQVLNLPEQERLDLMDQIWESLAKHPERIPVPPEHPEILEARLRAYRANPHDVVPWRWFEGGISSADECNLLADRRARRLGRGLPLVEDQRPGLGVSITAGGVASNTVTIAIQ